jgi:hypothetical protein
MRPDTAGAWASCLLGEDLDPIYDFHTICKVILNKVRPYRVNQEARFDEAQYMLITQSTKFDG